MALLIHHVNMDNFPEALEELNKQYPNRIYLQFDHPYVYLGVADALQIKELTESDDFFALWPEADPTFVFVLTYNDLYLLQVPLTI